MNTITDEDLIVPNYTGDPHPPDQNLATHDGSADISLTKEFVQQLLELRDLYENAESGNTSLEALGEGIQLPVVNELRYSGRHLVDALVCNDVDSSHEELSKAKKHCIRAKYDVAKGGLLYCVRRITRFRDDYRQLQLITLVPNYHEIIRRFEDARVLLGTHKNLENKEDYFDVLKQALDDLKDDERNLESLRDDLNKELQRLHDEEVTAVTNLKCMIRNVAIGFGGLILVGIGTVWTIYHDDNSAYETRLSTCISTIAQKLIDEDPSKAYEMASKDCKDLVKK